MALTGFVDDYPSDYEMVDARPEVESDRRDGSVEEEDTINNLNASNLEEHDKNMGGGGGLENARFEATRTGVARPRHRSARACSSDSRA